MTTLGGRVREIRSRLKGAGKEAALKRPQLSAGILAVLAFVLLIGYSASFTVYQIAPP